MKKILFVVPSLSGGGAERVVSIWTNELAKLNVNIEVLVFYRIIQEYTLDEKIKIHSLKPNKEEYDKLKKYEKLSLLRSMIKEISPEIVVPFISYVGIIINIATFGLGIKIVETVRNNPSLNPQNNFSRILRDFSVMTSKACIVQNEQQKKHFLKLVQKKIKIFPNPIPKEIFELENVKKSSEITKIIAVGRLETQKNYPMLINAIHLLNNPNVTLRIFGEGSLKAELQKKINDLELDNQITLCGRTNKIIDELVDSDLYILTSNYEGMPNSLMEAMATGKACISTDCPTGPSDIIDHNINGLLIGVGKEDDLIRSINKLINNQKEAILMGDRAKEKMKYKFSSDVSAKSLLDYLNSI